MEAEHYQDIVGECISLQDRFPLAVCGYVYLHPLRPIKEGKGDEKITHHRYAKMYRAITGRRGHDFKNVRGVYDQFAYMIVDFNKTPPELRDDIVQDAAKDVDLRVETFVERMIATFNDRTFFLDLFK